MFSLCVLCLLYFMGNSYAISNHPAVPKSDNQTPDRRFYFYNPELLPHAAATLGMVLQQPFYKPMESYGPSLTPVHFADYGGGEEEEEIEEHDEKPPLQLFTLVKPPKMSKHGKKKKKHKGHHQQHKPLKHFKKLVKKCLPFKVRIIKKSDIDNNDDLFYKNIRSQLPYGYGDEYFPQPPDKQELAVISLNTSNISQNGARFPQVLHFLYPRYNIRQPRPKSKLPPPRKTYRFARPPPTRMYRKKPRRPWPKVNPWRVVPASNPVSEYPLKEPTPNAVGGSPPPSPLFKIYKDPRIPVSQEFIADEQTESSTYIKGTPDYVHVPPTTPTQIQHYQEEMVVNSNGYNNGKYSDPDYFRYGVYNQEYVQEANTPDQESQYNTNYNTIIHSYNNFATEKIVTVTPTTSWVPIPQQNRVTQSAGQQYKLKNVTSLENKKINYMVGGFKNLTSNFKTGNETSKFGDKIVASTSNCSLPKNNCLEQSHHNNNQDLKQNKRIVNTKGSSKYHNKQKGGNKLERGSIKYSSKHKNNNQNEITNLNARFYGEEQKHNLTDIKIQSRSYSQETEIVTAKYPQDNVNEIYKQFIPRSLNTSRARRSNFKGLSTMVSVSMQVKEE